jgi:hypothetical protein
VAAAAVAAAAIPCILLQIEHKNENARRKTEKTKERLNRTSTTQQHHCDEEACRRCAYGV